jgi:hypothetical protein
MADKVWREGRWYYDIDYLEIRHLRAGYYEPQERPNDESIDAKIPHGTDLNGLVKVLEDIGYLKPRLDERLRTEDLKITHRLLDILEKRGG